MQVVRRKSHFIARGCELLQKSFQPVSATSDRSQPAARFAIITFSGIVDGFRARTGDQKRKYLSKLSSFDENSLVKMSKILIKKIYKIWALILNLILPLLICHCPLLKTKELKIRANDSNSSWLSLKNFTRKKRYLAFIEGSNIQVTYKNIFDFCFRILKNSHLFPILIWLTFWPCLNFKLKIFSNFWSKTLKMSKMSNLSEI